MILILLIIAAFVLLVLQTSLPPLLVLEGARPQILQCLVAYAALSCNFYGFLTFCFVAGLMQDALSHNTLGLSVLIFAIPGCLLHSQRLYFSERKLLVPLLVGGVLSLLVGFLSLLSIQMVHSGTTALPGEALRQILWMSLLNALLCPLVFIVLDTLAEALGEEPVKIRP
ncbi:MAG: rod shape-determining protein MreD [Verrucomicrobiae bacterium]|nr:rod shape-determining protein MreD [Verrucomicrobiae bacterium]